MGTHWDDIRKLASPEPKYWQAPEPGQKDKRRPPENQAWLFGVLGGCLAILALRFFGLWQDYQNFWVQAFTGSDGTVYGLLALFCAAGSAFMFYRVYVELQRGKEKRR